MVARKHHPVLTVLLIVVLFANLLNVQVAFADGETPTEPPAATEVVTEAPVESTPVSVVESTAEPVVESTPSPEGATPVPTASEAPEAAPTQEPTADEAAPVVGVLSDVPEDTNLVVLDEDGEPLALGSQETADAVVNADPVWCPAGVHPPTPGANGCSPSYASITDLLSAMRTDPGSFDLDGTIYLEVLASPGFTTPLILNDSDDGLAGSYATLRDNDLTIRGGWNPGTGTVSGTQALFGVSGSDQGYILIGSLTNPWAGNIRLEDIEVRDISETNAITIYTSSGNIVFDDVDVAEQTGGYNTVYLHSQSGNITVGNGGQYDSNDTGSTTNESKGFYARTGTGSIDITGIATGTNPFTFQDSEGITTNNNGATLDAPSVTLTNVVARDNDGNGIQILNASTVTLNNVLSSPSTARGTGNGLSGLLVNGTGSTIVNVVGGAFAKNGNFGLEIYGGTLVFVTDPACPSAPDQFGNGSGCSNVTPVAPTEPTPTEPTPTEPTPTEPTPTEPTPTEPTPTEPSPTEPSPTEPTSTEPSPTEVTSTPVPTQSTQAPPAVATPAFGSSNSQSSSPNLIIPLTGGELIDLECNSVFWAFGVKLSFLNLCDQQTTIHSVEGGDLPGDLPAGFTFVLGLDVDVLTDGQSVDSLPDGTGVQIDFPTAAAGEYAVLFWDEGKGEWVEISSQLDSSEISQTVGENTGNGLYQLLGLSSLYYPILTTNQTGIFVLVQK